MVAGKMSIRLPSLYVMLECEILKNWTSSWEEKADVRWKRTSCNSQAFAEMKKWIGSHFFLLFAAFHLDDVDVIQEKQVPVIITELNTYLAQEKLKEDSAKGGMVGCRLRLCVIPINQGEKLQWA